MASVIMPKMGDAMEEGTIVQFLKKVGDTVGSDDALFEIETDKSNVEVPAGEAGVVHEILFSPGQTVPVGTAVATIGQGAAPEVAPNPNNGESANSSATPPPVPEGGAASPSPAAETAATPSASHPEGTRVSKSPSPVSFVSGKPLGDTYAGAFPENLGGTASVLGEPIADVAPGSNNGEPSTRVKASPLARAMAAAGGISLASIAADGPVKAADVTAALSAPKTVASAPVVDESETQVYNGMRKTIARRLTESKQTIPHFYVTVEIDMEELLSLREKVNAGAEKAGAPKVSVNDCLIKAVATALMANPNVNSRFDDNKRVVSKSAHVGFGVALEDGLIVPVVRSAEKKSLRELASETKPLIDKARAGKLQPADYTGGTFTISNLGAVAEVENFSAIVNPGEGAILAVAATRSVPAVVNGQITVRKRMKVTLSADHRVVDGADAAGFLGDLKRLIENPLEMLA